MRKIYLATLLFSVFSSVSYSQTVAVLQASQDNTIYSDLTANSNGAGENFTAGTIVTGSIRRGLLRFDLSSLPAGATVTSVSLRLVVNKSASVASAPVFLYALNSAWGEGASQATTLGDGQGVAAQAGDATWVCSFSDGAGGCTTAWTPGGTFQPTLSASTTVGAPGAYTWSGSQVLANVQGWVNSASSNYGWIIRGDEATPQSARRFASRTNAVAADRPTLTITYNSLVPVNLLFFKVQSNQFGNRLTWQTSQEVNNDHFDIEHSQDGVHFISIGSVPGAGNSAVTKSYSYTHAQAVPGEHFYRLVQTDYDGRKTWSEIAYVLQPHPAKKLMIGPNPVTDRILLPGFSAPVNTHYSILNGKGQVLVTSTFSGNSLRLPGQITAGAYFLRIWNANGEVLTGAFLKH
jgi:hypothetical protein